MRRWGGRFEQNGSTSGGDPVANACFRTAMCEPQTNPEDFCNSGSAGDGSGTEVEVVSSVTTQSNPNGAGDFVTPRNGSYFVNAWIDKTKNYVTLNSGSYPADDPRLNKPRNAIGWANSLYRWNAWDDVAWIGQSIWIPNNFEVDNGQTFYDGRVMELGEHGHRAGKNHFILKVGTENQLDSEAGWHIEYYINDTGDSMSGARALNLGSIADDRGKWTDWVYRFRANPFSSTTVQDGTEFADAVAGTYQGNQGIFEVFKSVGGAMKKVYSLVNAPFGVAPSSNGGGTRVDFRMYKFGWIFSAGGPSPSTVVGPQIALPRDELRLAYESLGAGFTAVDPGLGTEPTNTPVEGVDYTLKVGSF